MFLTNWLNYSFDGGGGGHVGEERRCVGVQGGREACGKGGVIQIWLMHKPRSAIYMQYGSGAPEELKKLGE